ncbi:MAG TPA: menaquinone biosynthesis protein [Bacteroidales bacterium]|jgi:chorismate dehydratase|nr:menaquinone biosynthesis protein [Bacteroidales bacterium]HPT10503.1 menaquinone biosynthesis protein [Bacteroidales bacterium]
MIKISAVSYLNTYPFVYGLQRSGLLDNLRLELDVPSVCAFKLKNDQADIALVPVGALPDFDQYELTSRYCIGAVNQVKTVLLLSKVPLKQISKVHLDFDSRTSVRLVRVLAEHCWQITPEWVGLQPGQASKLTSVESMVAIGDKTFALRVHFPYVYDLAEEWIGFTGLPFVFAVWLSLKKIPQELLLPFENALHFGVQNIPACLNYFRNSLPAGVDCREYLEKNISYILDEEKRKGLDKFLAYLR